MEASLRSRPEWAQHREGDRTKWDNPGFFTRLIRSLFGQHIPCGGTWQDQGSEGFAALSVWTKCSNCGAQVRIRESD
jgi:hypothetical protein